MYSILQRQRLIFVTCLNILYLIVCNRFCFLYIQGLDFVLTHICCLSNVFLGHLNYSASISAQPFGMRTQGRENAPPPFL